MESDEVKRKFAEKTFNYDDIKRCTEDGSVDFSKSNKPYQGGKLYVIEGKSTKDEDIVLEVVNYDNKVLLKDVKKQ